eukprot:SAG31_NODE_5274_length_2638_cov_1.420244_2_plen_96_part_00
MQATERELLQERDLRVRAEDKAAHMPLLSTSTDAKANAPASDGADKITTLEHELHEAKTSILMLRAARKETVERAKEIVRQNGAKVFRLQLLLVA